MSSLTIGVLSRNNEKHISELLDSIGKQTCKNFDLIILDNGSDDATTQIIQSFDFANLDCIKLKNVHDTSEANGMKLLFQESRSTYISIVHGDDLLKPNYVRDVLEIVKRKSSFDAITFPIEHLDESQVKPLTNNAIVSRANLTSIAVLNRFLVCGLNPGLMPGTVFKRESIVSTNLLSPIADLPFNFDIVFWIRFSRNHLKLMRSSVCNYIYRRHPQQSSSLELNSLNVAKARNFNYENASTFFERFLVLSSTRKESALVANSNSYLLNLEHSYLEMSCYKLYLGSFINLILRISAKLLNTLNY
jgi:glycosyltransferase involved in cell wall biosynthesis